MINHLIIPLTISIFHHKSGHSNRHTPHFLSIWGRWIHGFVRWPAFCHVYRTRNRKRVPPPKVCIPASHSHILNLFPQKWTPSKAAHSQIRIPPQQIFIPILNQNIHRIIQPLLRRGDLSLMGNRLPLRPLLRVRAIHPPPLIRAEIISRISEVFQPAIAM